MRRRWAAVLAMAVASVAAPRAVRAQEPPPESTPPAAPAEAIPTSQPASTQPSTNATPIGYGATVADLRQTLANPGTSAADRLEIARRLVARGTPEARDALREVVASPANMASRLAALRALADDTRPDATLVAPLVTIVQTDTDREIAGAAAVALGTFQNNPEAVKGLSQAATATTRSQPLRSAAIRGLGLLVDRDAAATLVGIVTNASEPTQIVSDAADALVDLTGVEANGRDPAKWASWQTQHSALQPPAWKAAIADSRAPREQRARRRMDELVDELQPTFEEQIRATPPAEVSDRILRLLGAASPEIRRVGARIADRALGRVFGPQGLPGPLVQARLEDLIGDADPAVRLESAKALENFNLGERSLLAIRQQLTIETDIRVKAAMARTLSKFPALQLADLGRLLDDESPAVIYEAADALRRRASTIKGQQLTEATTKLQDTVKRLPSVAAFLDAKRMCIAALKALDEPSVMTFGKSLLDSPQPELRASGMTVLGELGTRSVPTIISSFDRDNRQDPASVRVRRSGMDALARAGDFDKTVEWLRLRSEPNAEVRAAARNTYRALLPKATIEKLDAERKTTRDDPAMRAEILSVMVSKYKQNQQLEDAAAQQVSLGTEYVNLGRPADAAVVQQDALNYYLGRGDGPQPIEPLLTAVTDSLLKSQQYAKLAAMAQSVFLKAKSQSEEYLRRYQQRVGSRVRNEARALVESTGPNKEKDWANAAALIDAVSRMDPPIAKTYLDELRTLGVTVKQQQRAATQPTRRP